VAQSHPTNLSGVAGESYDIQRPADLVNWTVLGTVTAPAHGVFSSLIATRCNRRGIIG
jgi:hypothetical protein